MLRHKWHALFLPLLAVGLALSAILLPPAARAVDKDDLRRALLATVRVAVPIENQRDAYSTGSGTILTTDGLVLTNFHVVGDVERGSLYNRDGVAFIAVNPPNLKGLPTWLYQAELLKADPNLDLALLKITGYMEGNNPLPKDLALVTMDLGNSEDVTIGDELSVVGFPGIGGDTVTFTQGRVAGFLDEDSNGEFEWIKTDAEVNHGNSGGLAIDANGAMIGVPTAGYSDPEAAGKISLVRPINLAAPLLRAAQLQPASSSSGAGCPALERNSSGATITDLVFARSVDRKGVPSGVGASFESGLNTVYAVFDYDRFRNGKDFRFSWHLDGEQIYEDGQSWGGGSRGTEWVNVYSDSELPDGLYMLELRFDNTLLACDTFTLGQVATRPGDSAVFGPITFASDQQNDQPVDPGDQFPSGATSIYAFFDYSDMADGMAWRQIWYVDGEVGLDKSDTWNAGEEGNYWISIGHDEGLPDGDYALELYVEDQLVQSGEFAIDGGGGTPLPTNQGVVVIGSVVDANRRSRPVVGALVIFLNPGVDIQRWARNRPETDVYTMGVSDESGQFQLATPVEPGQTYPIVVVAEGYRAVTEQNFVLPADAASPFEMEITMVRE